uniref:Uncharacterized protein n=1 Tax=Physcomitrium patens TaxID=3218 RepID=A0A2K1KGW6_PHYPA|nr:hypothetical protein PHYPA_009378 [Physcomitrium patens]
MLATRTPQSLYNGHQFLCLKED